MNGRSDSPVFISEPSLFHLLRYQYDQSDGVRDVAARQSLLQTVEEHLTVSSIVIPVCPYMATWPYVMHLSHGQWLKHYGSNTSIIQCLVCACVWWACACRWVTHYRGLPTGSPAVPHKTVSGGREGWGGCPGGPAPAGSKEDPVGAAASPAAAGRPPGTGASQVGSRTTPRDWS